MYDTIDTTSTCRPVIYVVAHIYLLVMTGYCIDVVLTDFRGVPMMTMRNYSTAGAIPVIVRPTNIEEQAPLLPPKSRINRHTTNMPVYVSCRACMAFSLCSCILRVTSVYVSSLIILAIPLGITPLRFGLRCKTSKNVLKLFSSTLGGYWPTVRLRCFMLRIYLFKFGGEIIWQTTGSLMIFQR